MLQVHGNLIARKVRNTLAQKVGCRNSRSEVAEPCCHGETQLSAATKLAEKVGGVLVLFSYPPALQRKWPRAEVGPWPRPCHGEASTGPLLAAGLRGRPVWAGRRPQRPAAVQGRRPQRARAAAGCAAFTELRSGDGALLTAKALWPWAGVHLEAAASCGCAARWR